MADELIDIFDEENNFTGIQKMKSEAHAEGLWHRTAHVWIYNSKKEILLQLRAKDKDVYPDCWDISSAGHVVAGEDPEVSAIRELKEELGIDAEKEDLKFLRIRKSVNQFKEIKNSEIVYIFLMKFEGAAENLNLQKEELQGVKFFQIDELKEDLEKNSEKFVPHGKYFDEIIEKVKELS